MLIATYTRVSTDRQVVEGLSLHDQLQQINAWAKNKDHIVVRDFVEPGASAFDDRRPVFDEMIEAATAKPAPFEAIVVHSMTRFYRDNAIRELVERKLEKNGVRVISITEPLPEDEASAKLMRNIVGIMGEWQSRENAKHVIRCQRDNAKLGYYNGAQPPFGYMAVATEIPARSGYKKILAINNEEAEVVRTIFTLAADGLNGQIMGTKKIAAHLNEQGITRRGRKWRKQCIWNLLSSSIYVGERITFKRNSKTNTLNPESEWITSKVPAIIDEELFARAAQARESRDLPKREAKAIQSPSLLTGLLKCDCCGGNYNVMTGKSGHYGYYRCATKSDSSVKSCGCPNIPKEPLEKLVSTTIAREILTKERITEVLAELQALMKKKAEPDAKRLLAAQRAIAIETEKLTALYEQIATGLLSLEGSLKEHLENQQRKLATLQAEVTELSRRQQLPIRKFGPQQVEDFAMAAQESLLAADSPWAKGYLRAIVSEIRVSKVGATIRGNRAQLAAAISTWRPGTAPVVPSLVSNWRGISVSNRLPPARQAGALPIELMPQCAS